MFSLQRLVGWLQQLVSRVAVDALDAARQRVGQSSVEACKVQGEVGGPHVPERLRKATCLVHVRRHGVHVESAKRSNNQSQ